MKFLRKNLKLLSFDITNMYSNIPTKNLIGIIVLMCNQNNINEELKHEIRKLSQVLIKQNISSTKTYNIYIYIYIYI
jgi:hypothetical protein